MKILITGATGLIGTQVVKQCLAKGYSVNYLTTDATKIKSTSNYKGFLWNPNANEIDKKCLKHVDAIIHLVGSNIASRWTTSYKKTIIESRTQTTTLLYNTLKDNNENIKSIVSASGVSIYPSSYKTQYTEYFIGANSSFLADVVLKWETAVNQFQTITSNVAKLRIGLVLAKEGGALPQLKQNVQNYFGAPLGSGKQWQSWIHIEDLANLFIFSVEHELKGIYNATTSNPYTNNDIIKHIGVVLRKPILPFNIPATVLKLILGEMSSVILESQFASNSKLLATGFKLKYNQLLPALEDVLD